MDEPPRFSPWERVVFVSVVLIAAAIGVWQVTTWPDLVGHWNAIGQLSVYVGALYLLINARRVIQLLMTWIVTALVREGVIVRPAAPESAKKVRKSDLDVSSIKTADRLRAQSQPATRSAWLSGFLLALILAVLAMMFWPRDWWPLAVAKAFAPVGQQIAFAEKPPQECAPTYCTPISDRFACVLPEGGSPTTVARDFVSDPLAVGLLADQIWNDNRSSIGERTDRQIPPNTPFFVRVTPEACR